MAFIFFVDGWVAIVESRRSGREIVNEGYYLISTMLSYIDQVLGGYALQILCEVSSGLGLREIFCQDASVHHGGLLHDYSTCVLPWW